MTNFVTTSFDDTLSQDLLRVALTNLDAGVYRDFHGRIRFLEACSSLKALLEDSVIGDHLAQLRNGNIVGLVLKNTPTDPALCAAPDDGHIPRGKSSFVSEGLACALGQCIGWPSALIGEKQMQLIHQITPVKGLGSTQSNAGKVELMMHQDLAPNMDVPYLPYHAAMATWLILSGLQIGAGGTSTYVSPIDDGLELLDEETLWILRQPQFVTDPPDSFKLEGMEGDLPPHPILIEHEGQIEAAFDISSNVRPVGPTNGAAARAIIDLHTALAKVKHEVFIEPGTVVVFNNRRVVHGRGAVRPGVSNPGEKRWIQRLQVFELERMLKLSMRYIGTTVVVADGFLHIADGQSEPNPKILEEASLVA